MNFDVTQFVNLVNAFESDNGVARIRHGSRFQLQEIELRCRSLFLTSAIAIGQADRQIEKSLRAESWPLQSDRCHRATT